LRIFDFRFWIYSTDKSRGGYHQEILGQAGVNVSFGCDGAASNDSQDLLEAIKIGSILHKITDLDYRQ
jgi:cytosine/adenosine deaminase-related metal-dependent hydrolase